MFASQLIINCGFQFPLLVTRKKEELKEKGEKDEGICQERGEMLAVRFMVRWAANEIPKIPEPPPAPHYLL